MKHRSKIFLLLAGVPLSAFAGGFKMGLGNAAAKTGAAVFEKAAERSSSAQPGGGTVDESLPTCGSDTPYTVSPVAVSDIQGIDPLGHVNPSGHTFPSDHIYFYLQPADAAAPTGSRVVATVIAPGNVHITSISYAYINGNRATTDYGLEFHACRELKSYFGHVQTLSPALLSQLNNARQNCMDYETGGNTFHSCNVSVDVPVAAGETIGTAGGSAAALDFGSYDYRRTPIAFLSPARHPQDQPFTVCPIDYFASTLKATLESHLGRWDGGVTRTVAPVCGEILYDVAGTAAGDWYKTGAPDSPEDPHLALIHDNVYPAREDLSIGTSVAGTSPLFYPFDPQRSGTHNRDFAQVSADGQVYCYDTFYDPLGQPASPGYSLLLTMPTSTTVRVEKNASPSCGAGPWTMDSSYGEFQR